MSPSEKAQAEALEAVTEVYQALRRPGELTERRRYQLAATLEYAWNRIFEIQAVKKARRVPTPDAQPNGVLLNDDHGEVSRADQGRG